MKCPVHLLHSRAAYISVTRYGTYPPGNSAITRQRRASPNSSMRRISHRKKSNGVDLLERPRLECLFSTSSALVVSVKSKATALATHVHADLIPTKYCPGSRVTRLKCVRFRRAAVDDCHIHLISCVQHFLHSTNRPVVACSAFVRIQSTK